MSDHIVTEGLTAWRVPHHSVDPSDQMVEWLNTCPIDWDGDESGVVIGDDLAAPGDWVVEHRGQWFVLHRADLVAIARLVMAMSAHIWADTPQSNTQERHQ